MSLHLWQSCPIRLGGVCCRAPGGVGTGHTSSPAEMGLRRYCSVRRCIVLLVVAAFIYVVFFDKSVGVGSQPRGDRASSASIKSAFYNMTPTYWPCFHAKNSHGKCSKLLLELRQKGSRLGNDLFGFAASLGIAQRYNMTPVIRTDNQLFRLFHVSVPTMSTLTGVVGWAKIREKGGGCRYDEHLEHIKRDSEGQNIHIRGYFQSWKYFQDPDVINIIRSQLRFRPEIMSEAEAFVDDIRWNEDFYFQTVVGVHIRRGDMVDNPHGYVTAPAEYVRKAFGHFRWKYGAQTTAFIICTDSPDWVQTNFDLRDKRVFLSVNHTAPQDLAILSLCDHTIMTVGSFGWWGAFLAGGDTIFYGGYPEPGSRISKVFSALDYYPDNWRSLV